MGSPGRLCALLCLLGTTALLIQACHHQKENTDTFTTPAPSRKRRQIGSNTNAIISFLSSGTTPYPRSTNFISPTIPTPFRDRDAEVSKFFTDCMKKKKEKEFQSWTSVIDFIIRDTKWYSATDVQFCPENKDKDDSAVECWQNRLSFLLKNKSELLSSGRNCIAEYDVFHLSGKGSNPQRKKRSTGTQNTSETTRISNTSPVRCPAVFNARFSACLGVSVTEPSKIAEYPSLIYFDPQSVEKFVTEQFTDCRVQTVRDSPYIKSYREVCPLKSAPSRRNCYILTLLEIIKATSPLASSATSCQVKLLSELDKCKDKSCDSNSYCDPNVGTCICIAGYTRNNGGPCESDPCFYAQCEESKECRKNLITNQGECICKNGLIEINGVCTTGDPCKNVQCQSNSICYSHRGQGYCICNFGYGLINNECVADNPCSKMFCPQTKVCQVNQGTGQGECVCQEGYIQRRNGNCVACPAPKIYQSCPTACPKTCDNPNPSVCFEACRFDKNCVCPDEMVQFTSADNSPCVSPSQCPLTNPCGLIFCEANKVCRVNRATGLGECVCEGGYNQLTNGKCVSCPAPKKFKICPTACPKTCSNPNPSFCIEVCSLDKYCECPEGMLQLTSDDNSACVRPSQCPAICRDNLCPRNSRCVGGKCTCNSGYRMDNRGRRCIVLYRCPQPKVYNPCPTQCTATCDNLDKQGIEFCASVCRPNVNCVCPQGMVERSRLNNTCVYPGQCRERGTTGQCAGVRCTGNKVCMVGEGGAVCICPPEHTEYDGICFKSNVCQFVSCEVNKVCEPDPATGSTTCVCKKGLTPTSTGGCQGETCEDKTQCNFLSCLNVAKAIRDCRKTCGFCLFASLG